MRQTSGGAGDIGIIGCLLWEGRYCREEENTIHKASAMNSLEKLVATVSVTR